MASLAWYAPLGRLSGLVLALALIGAVSGYCFFALTQARQASRQVEHTQAVLAQLRNVVDAAREATEARQMPQHRAAVARAEEASGELRALIRNDPVQQARWEQLEALFMRGLVEAGRQLERRAAGAPESASPPGDAELRERARAIIGEKLREMLREEGRVLRDSSTEAERQAGVAQQLLLVGTSGSLALILAVFALMRREAAVRRGVEAALKRANAGLEAAVADQVRELQAEIEERRRAGELLEALVQQSVQAIFALDPQRRVMFWNPAAERMFGYAAAEIVGQPYPLVPENGQAEHEQIFQRFAAGQAMENLEVVRRHKDGRLITALFSGTPLYDQGGGLRGIAFIGEDVTQRRAVEEQLRQAQKMEAVGQLTGGVAHDFNNLLLVIQGSLELAEEDLGDRPSARRELQRAIRASERGATLTRSLLAFARKQPLDPSRVDVNRLVVDMVDLLGRTLGEAIEIKLVSGTGLWPCEVDPGQLQNALINLAINARDAMPKGGKLTIETANAQLDEDYAAQHVEVAAGDYVSLVVSDTGTGMAPAVIRRAFDPFFTTKVGGRGSGLGLSMVYGFVKQSGGHVKIYSETGMGTTIKLYLPRSRTGELAPAEHAAAEGLRGGSETVLVVEDDADVRDLTVNQLSSLGYTALEAVSAAQALDILAASRIDLLLTDVVLAGGMNGRDLAAKAVALRPDLRVLYMSGYTENAILHHGRLDPGVHLLQKPFRKHDLAAKLRGLLDGSGVTL